jgi:translation elongation factor EF-Tu-like GTPase
MKKRFISGLIICATFLLMACGKQEVTVEVLQKDTVEESEITKVERTGEMTGLMKLEDCFALTDSGFVLTGVVESGEIRVGDEVIIVKADGNEMKATVLSIDKFREVIDVAVEGDSLGVLVDIPERIEIVEGDKMEVYAKQEIEE